MKDKCWSRFVIPILFIGILYLLSAVPAMADPLPIDRIVTGSGEIWLATDPPDSQLASNDGQGPGGLFEDYGLGNLLTEDTYYFVLASAMPIGGVAIAQADDGFVHQGDIMWHFNIEEGDTLAGAAATSDFYGLRYVADNDSSAPPLVLLNAPGVGSVTGQNAGFSSLAAYDTRTGGNWRMGNVPREDAIDYLGTDTIENVVTVIPNVTTEIGNFVLLDSVADAAVLADFKAAFESKGVPTTGVNYYGAKFDLNQGGQGALVFATHLENVFVNQTESLREYTNQECGNDGMMKHITAIPEIPTHFIMTFFFMMGGVVFFLRRRILLH